MLQRLTSLLIASAVAAFCLAEPARCETHSYVAKTRTLSDMFFVQGIEGEYGRLTLDSDVATGPESKEASFGGYAVRSGVGVEMGRFVRFAVTHSLFDLRRESEGDRASLRGSRFAGEMSAVFIGPLFNIEFGGAACGSTSTLETVADSAGYMGSGSLAFAGIEHFMSYHISLGARGEVSNERMLRRGHDEALPVSILRETTSLMATISIWL